MRHICIHHRSRFECDGKCSLPERIPGPCCGAVYPEHTDASPATHYTPRRVQRAKPVQPQPQIAASGNLFQGVS